MNWSSIVAAKEIVVVDPDTKGSWGLIRDGILEKVVPFDKPSRVSWTADYSKNSSITIANITPLYYMSPDVVFIEEQYQKMREGGKITSYHTFAKIVTAFGDADIYALSPKRWHTLCRDCNNLIGTFPASTRIPKDVTKQNSLAYALMYQPSLMVANRRMVRGKGEWEYTQSVADVVVMAHWIIKQIKEFGC